MNDVSATAHKACLMSLIDALKQMFRDPGTALDLDLTMPFGASQDAPPLWQMSSFELMNGVDVSEFPSTDIGEPFDSLFPR